MDTNVLFQSLYSSTGASHAILRLIRVGKIQLALSVLVYGEYQDVLTRPEIRKDIRLSREEVQTVSLPPDSTGKADQCHRAREQTAGQPQMVLKG